MAKRRSPGEGRDLLLEAAREIFSERGYSGTSTREIAERAGMAEVLLFRNFGSKAGLYSQVVLGFIEEFVSGWKDLQSELTDDWTDEQLAQEFVGRLYDLFCDRRGLVLSYITTSVFDPEVVNLDQAPTFIEALDRLAGWGEREFVQPRHLAPLNILVANRAIIGMILSQALLNQWLPNGPAAGNRDEFVAGLTDLILYGIDGPEATTSGG